MLERIDSTLFINSSYANPSALYLGFSTFFSGKETYIRRAGGIYILAPLGFDSLFCQKC